tara:strand:- start:4721 stop:5194 length:474 start_codon:yes stop_codon:yes gene_type:complete
MWQDKLKEIIYILENSNVNEIEINFWGRRYRVSKQPSAVVQDSSVSNSQTSSKNLGQPVASLDESQDIKKIDEVENVLCEDLLSPMPGTFYTAPTPDDEPFVSVGDKIKKGQTLCIIEAMKIMNEIESELDGTIINIKVNNGDPVEYNQTLFEIKPT